MLLLISSKSALDADQAAGFVGGNPSLGGGPLTEIESTYNGFGFLVDRAGRDGRFNSSGVHLLNMSSVISGPFLTYSG